jgi:two-component system response regulator BaeR
MSDSHVLIVEDEENLAQLMRDYLQKESIQVSLLHTGKDVEAFVQQHKVDVLLLDLMLPGKSGIDVCRDIRKFSDVPIIMTTAKVEEIDRILGLEIGANDYVCKPYSPRELVARVKVQLRSQNLTTTSNQSLALDANQLMVRTPRSQIELTSVEFNLLSKLYSQPARVFNRDQLMDAVYSDGRIVSDRTIDSHIKKIRQKLRKLDEHDYVQAVYGCGYKYVPKTIEKP